MLALPVDCLGDFGPRGLAVQYTQDVSGCPPAHTGCLWLSVSVRRPWLSISTHISTLVLGLSTLALPMDCSGDFGPRGLSVQYTQDVHGCPSEHTGRLWVSVNTHRTSVAVHVCSCVSVCVRQHTQDIRDCPSVHILAHWKSVAVRVCPRVSISTHRTSMAFHQYTYQHVVLGLSTLTLPVDCSGDFGPLGLFVQYTQDVRGCLPAHTGRPTHIRTLVLGLSTLTLPVDCLGDFGPRGLSVQYTQDVRWCPPAHTGRLWLSVSTHRTSVAVRVCPSAHTRCLWVSVSTHRTSVAVHVCVCVCPSAHTGRLWLSISTHISTMVLGLSTLTLPMDCSSDFGPRGLSVQYTQDVRGCPPAHTGRPWLSVCVCVCLAVSITTHRMSEAVHQYTYQHDVQYTQDVCGCPPAHTGRLWLSVALRQHTQDICGCPCVSVSTHRTSVAVHQYTYQTLVLGLNTLALPVDCSGDFGPRGLSVQYTLDVRGCLSADTRLPWVSVSTHWTSVAVRQHTQDVRGCPSVHISAHCTHRTSVCVRQHTQDVRGCMSAHTRRPCVSISRHRTSVAVHVCPSAHTGRQWLSISTHISTLVLGLSTLTLPVDCSGDFGPRGLSVQYAQDVRGCPLAYTRRLWLSLAIRQHTQDICGCPCVSVCVRQHTQNVCGCPTLVLGLSPLALPVDCSGDFGPRGLSVQYTEEVRGCPSAHTGRPCVSVSTHRTSVAVCVCPSAHTGRPWLSICTHISTLVFGLSTLTLPVDCSGDFGPRGVSVQYTQHIRGCPPAHTGRPWLSISTHISTLVLGLSTLTLPVDCSGDFGPRGLSVQYTQDVRGTHRMYVAVHQYTYQHVGPWTQHAGPFRGLFGCLFSTHMTSVGVCQHTQAVCGCLWLSISTHRISVAVRVCLWVSVSTHKTSVAVHVCPSIHTGRPWLSISTHISTLVLGLSTLTRPMDSSGDFGPRGLFVQYTQDVCGCPPAHTGSPTSVAVRVCPSAHTRCLWVSVSTHRTSVAVRVCLCVSVSTHRTSVAVHQYTYQHVVRTGRPWVSTSIHKTSVAVLGCPSGDTGHLWLSVCVCMCPSAHTECMWVSVSTHRTFMAVHVCPCVSVSSHRTSVAVHQYTYQHAGPWTQPAGPSRGLFGTSVAVCVCPSAHTGRPWLSICTHISTLVLGLSTLTLPVDCSGDFGPRGLSVQYTQHVRGCPPAHTGRSWLSISTHISTLVLGLSTLGLPVDCSGDFGPRGLSVQYTQEVRGCPSAHTGRPCVSVSTHRTSVAVCVCPSAHTGRPWLSICTHISTLVFGLSTLTLPVDCSGDFGPRGVSVQYTQHVRGCPPAHTGRPWLSISTHISTLVLGLSTLTLPVDCSGDFGPRGLSVQYTQDVRGTHRMYVAVHQYTYQHVGPWTQHAGPFRGLFGCLFSTHMTSVGVCQHTQDVCGCLWLSISTHRISVAVRVCPWVSVSTHKTSVAVHVCPSIHTGRPWLSISTHISTLVLGLSTLTRPMDSSGDFGPRGLFVQYTQDVCGCPPAHTGSPWLSVRVRVTSVAVRVCPSAHTRCLWVSVSTHRTSVAVRVCLCVSVSTHRTSVAVHQYTYQHVVRTGRPWVSTSIHMTSVAVLGCPSAHTGHLWLSVCVCMCPSAHTECMWVSVSTHRTSMAVHVCPCVSVSSHRTSVAVHQYTYQHAGPWTQPAGPSRGLFGTSVAVCVCPSAHTGRPWLSICTHISTLVLGLSTLTLPVDCSGDFGPRGLSVQYTQDVRGTHRMSVAVHQYTYQHVGPWTQHAGPSRGLFGCLFSTHMTSVGVRQHTQDVCGCLWLSVSTHRTSVAVRVCPSVSASTHRTSYTLDVRGCPSADTRLPWVSVSTHRTSVAVRQHTEDVRGCPSVHISAHCTHRTSVCVRQHTQDVRGCMSAHTGRPCVSISRHRTSVAVHVCPSAHTGRQWLSISTHNSTLVLGLSTLTLPVDCSGDFGPRGLSVQYAQDVRGCPLAYTRRLWLSLAVRQHTQDICGCLCGSVCVRQHTHNVCGCPSAHTGHPWLSMCVCVCPSDHTGRLWLSISTHISTLVLGLSPLALPVDCSGDFGPRGLSVQYTQEVRGCPSAHTGRPCLSVSTHMTSVAVCVCPSAHTGRPWLSICTHISTLVLGLSTLTLPVDCSGDFGPRGLSVQYTLDVRGCPLAHTGRPWLSISTHISTLVLGLSTLTLPVDCSGDFGPRGLSVQYTQDVRGTHRMSVAVHQYTYQHVRPWTQHAGPSRGLFGCLFSTHMTSLGVRQHTQDVCGCLWLSVSTHRTSVAVRVCPSVSASTHRTSVAVHQYTYQHVVQYTLDVRGCPSADTRLPWVSVSTHRTSVAVRQHTEDVRGCPSVRISAHCTHRTSVCVRQHTQDVRGCMSAHTGRPCVSISRHRTSVAVHVCPSAHTGRQWLSISTHNSTLVLGLSMLTLPVDCSGDFGPHGLSVQYAQDVRGCPLAYTRRLWLSLAVRQHTQDICGCPCGSVCVRQHTQNVCGCPSAHTGHPWLSMCVCVCPSDHTGRLWLSISTHISTLVLGLSPLALPVDCSGDFGPRGLSVQYTQEVRGCPSAHTGRPCLSVSTHMTSVAVCVCPSAHTGRPWLSICTHISTLVLGLSTLTLPVDCSGDFGPRGLSVQYTQDVRGCPLAYTRRLWLSLAVRQHTQDICGCPCVSVCVRQHTHNVCGCPSAHTGRPWLSMCVRVCPSAHTGRLWLSISTHISMLVLGLSPLALPGDCSDDFGPRGLSVQYTQEVRGCPSAHTGRPCVSVSTHRMSVAVCVCPSAHTGRPWLSICTHIRQLVLGLSTLTLPVDSSGDFGATWAVCSVHTARPWVSPSTHRTAVAVHQYTYQHFTQDVRGCPPGHTGRPWLSVCVRVCPSLSVSTHRMFVAVHQYTYQHVGPWTQHAGPSRGLFGCLFSTHMTSVGVRQHTQDVCGCPSAHTGHPWPSVCVRVCLSAHTGRLWVSVSTHMTSMAVRVCPSAHIGRPWLSISTHISKLVLGLSTLVLPVDYLGDYGSRGLSVEYTQDVCGCPLPISARWSLDSARWPFPWTVRYTQDVRGCPSAHTGRPSAHTGRPYVSVSTHMTSLAVHVCPSAHTGRPWLSICTHISTLVLGVSTPTLPVDCSGDFGPRGLSVQYTQDVRGCPPAHTGRPWVSISTHISTLVLGLSTLTLPVDCSGDFGPRGLFVQYTQDVRGCPSAHAGSPWLSACVHQHTQDVHGCPSVHISYTQDVRGCPPAHTGRPLLSVFVRLCLPSHTGRPWLSISTHISMLVLGLCTLALPVDCLGDFGPRGLSVQYTQDVRWCPPAHTGRLWLSVAVCQHTQDVRGCPCVSVSTHKMSVGVRQHTQDVRGCPCVFVCVRQHTQDVCGCPSVHISALCTHMTSVGVRQHTQDVRGCPCVFVCVWLCPSAHTGCPWLSISTHISTLVLGLSSLALPVDCLGDFGPRGLSVQYTQDVCGCPPAHTGRLWLFVALRQHTQDVCGCPCVSVCVRQHTQDVRGCPSVHISDAGPWTQHAGPSRGLFGHKTSLGVRQHTQDVCGCPSAHTGRSWLSISTHISTLVFGLSTLTLPVDCSSDFGPRGLFVQYTQDVCVCPSAHTGRPWLSVCVCVCPSAHTGCLWLSISTHISTLVLGLSTLTHPMDCSSDFGPRGLSVQYTHDVRGCPPAHTGRPWLSVCVCVCLAVSVSTHRMSVAVHQYTYQHVGPWTQLTGPSRGLFGTSVAVRGSPSAHTGRLWLSMCVRQHTHDVRGCPSVHISDAGPRTQHAGPSRGLFGHKTSLGVRQHTQDVCGCPSAHTGRSWLSISTHISTLVFGLSTLTLPVDCSSDFGPRGMFVQYTQDVCVCPSEHTGRPWVYVSTHRTSVCVYQQTQDVRCCPCVSVSTHRTSVAVHQYTYQHVGPWTEHADPSRGLFGTFVAVCGCLSAHTGRPWLSVCVRQHTQDVCGCPSAHTGRLWLSVCVCVCPSAHTGRLWLSISTHISTLVLGLSTLTHPMDCSSDFGPRGLSVQYTHDVRGCPPAHTGRPWLSVCVCVCLAVSVSTHRMSVAVHQYTYQHVGAWTQLTGPSRGLFGTSVAVRGSPSAHTGRLWLSVCVRVCPSAHTGRSWLSISTHIRRCTHWTSVGVHQQTQDFLGCPSAHTGRLWLSVSTHRTFVAVHHTHRTSVCVRQHTQDVRGCMSAHTGRPCVSISRHRMSVAVHVCPSAHTGRQWLSISTHISTLVLGLSTLTLPVDCSGNFGPRGLSVQFTQDVRGCPPAHTGRPWLSVCVRVCPSVSVSTHRMSVAVHQYTYQHVAPWTQHADPSRGLFG
ncbi:hypothetical protein YC2023_066290 [Brassica napus]